MINKALTVLIAVIGLFSYSIPAHAVGGYESMPLYQALEKRLIETDKAIDKIKDNVEIPKIDFGSTRYLRQGDTHVNVPLLRAKLMDYVTEESFDTDPYLYDEYLFEAVKKYQEEKGLKNDGILGPQTLSNLNRTLEDEKKQILVNMYRLRQPEWQGRPDLRIEVNIPQFELMAYENNKLAFDMPVVVGTKRRQTVNFMTVMNGVRLNPGWTLPKTIKTEDYIPKLRSTPEWVTNQGVQIYSSWNRDAKPIDPTTIDWNYLSDGEIRAMRFYKNAGSNNPLGQYRFLMDNKYDIYLHDTNQKYLFDRTSRAKSSGCVRVFNPRRIAEFLLADDPDWTSEKLDNVLAGGKTYNLRATRSIPVYFDYKTAWLDNGGGLVLGHDIYGFDDGVYRDIISNYAGEMYKNEKLLED